MIPTIQFDLGTLTIWTTSGTLSGEIAKLASDVMATAVRGDDPTDLIIANTSDDAIRRRMQFLAIEKEAVAACIFSISNSISSRHVRPHILRAALCFATNVLRKVRRHEASS